MRQNRINRGFTLVEIVIVLVVVSLLIGVLFKVYQTITEISLRVRYEKELGNTVVTMQTIIQNIVDADTIDYAHISSTSTQSLPPGWMKTEPTLTPRDKKTFFDKNDLPLESIRSPIPGWFNTIPLITKQGKATLSLNNGQLILTTYSGNTSNTASLLGQDIILTNASFILSPITDPTKEKTFSQIYQPGFWLIGNLQPKSYLSLHFPVYTFFSFLQK